VERLLERDAALAELSALASAARRGAGRLVLLRGEAGVGKTAVITRCVAGLGAGVRVLLGWCDPLMAPRPLGPLLDALVGIGPAAAEGLSAAIESGDTGALYRRLLTVLRDGQRWVWAIEDAHWADGATLDLLRFLARRIESLPLLLVVSYRDDELDREHPLAVALGDVATCAGVRRIGLEPLSREAVAALAAGSGVNADQLHHLTGGNPFFVTEVLAGGAAALSNRLPRSVSEAVWGRLARLSSAARETAQAAAVCGPHADPALIREVCPAADEGLAECLDAGMLVSDGDVIRFRHELARRATLEQISTHQRTSLHARALAGLAESPVGPDALPALAFHAEEAGDRDAALRYGAAAAERAARLGAHGQAAELYALTLRHAGTAPDDQKVVWFEGHAFAAYCCGLGEAAVSSWREAITLRRMLGDTLGESENLRWLSHELWGMGHTHEAAETARAAMQVLGDAGPCQQLAWSLVNLAEVCAWGFDPAAVRYASQAIEVGTQLGDKAVVIRARGFAALTRVLGNDTGWEELEAAWREAMGSEGRGEDAGLLSTNLCVFAAQHFDLDRADRYIAESVAHCRDRNMFQYEALVLAAGAVVALHRGDWDRAAAAAEELLTRPAVVVVNQLPARLTLALVRARRGELAVAALLDDIAADSDHERLFPVWAARAEIAWLAGDDETARQHAQRGLVAIGPHGDPWLAWQLRRWDRLATGTATHAGVDNPLIPFHLEVSGDWQGAADAWMRRGCPYEAAIAQLGGDIAAVEAALATLRGLGARAAARRAQQRLAELRGPTRRSRPADIRADPHGLSRREREVITLIADGHSDAEIATKLSISPKTVGHHVSSILTKLGVANRTQAAARVRPSTTEADPSLA
jgi:DNA-binding CsgD family transcriptional regulator/tetratricopeptide (TPR) repeat protein